MEDFQLAIVIARLYENEIESTQPNFRRLLYEEILGCDASGNNMDVTRAHPDPFLRSMTLWMLNDYTGSLNTLLQTNVGSMHPMYNDDKPEATSGGCILGSLKYFGNGSRNLVNY